MPKITVRKDGTCFIRATPVPGSGLVRVWEVRKEGVAWLRRQGVGVEQEMGRQLFVQLLDRDYAYIAKLSKAPQHRSVSRTLNDQTQKLGAAPSRPARKRGTTTGVNPAQAAAKPAPKISKKQRRKQRRDGTGTALSTSLPTTTESTTIPEHWTRRTKKKDWFG